MKDANTVYLKIKHSLHIFQAENVLELTDNLIEGKYDGRAVKGYFLPDTGDGSPGILPADFAEATTAPDNGAGAYFGKCVLTQVINFYPDASKTPSEGETNNGIVKRENVEVIHYPDCQQLMFHMPKYAWDAGAFRIVDGVTGAVLEEKPVREQLNGGTMILLDTLPLKPGFYTIDADWPDGWTHRIKFVKMIPGFPKEETYRHPPGNVRMVQNDTEYRLFDSNGVEIDNGMQQIMAATDRIVRNLKRRVEYEQSGRAGLITYVEGDTRIVFDWEFAGGNGVVIIFVPNPGQWEKATGTPLARRQEILEFVSECVIRDQAPGCRYEIGEGYIDILKR